MICGHLRPVGVERVVHVCIKTDPNHTDPHLLLPWADYAAEQFRAHPDQLDTKLPAWFTELAVKAKRMNREQFVQALQQDPALRRPDPDSPPPPPLPDEDDPDHVKQEKWEARERWDRDHGPGRVARRCTTLRSFPPTSRNLQRCGRIRYPGEPHEHGDWQWFTPPPPDVPPPPRRTAPRLGGDPDLQPGYVPPGIDPEHVREREDQKRREREQRERDESGGYPLGRSQGETWKEVAEQDPDAWKAPDDGDRAAEPPEGGVPEADVGWSVTGRGKTPQVGHFDIKIDTPPPGAGGGSMASVAEVKAALDQVTHNVGEAQGILNAAIEKINEAVQGAMAAADGSGHDAVSTGNAHLGQAVEKVEEAVQALNAAVEAYGQYSAAL